MKHIPTLSVVFYKDTELYGYEYDDVNGLTQTEYGYVTLEAALADAFLRLKTFTILEGVESK